LLALGGTLLPLALVYYAIVVVTRTGRIPVFSGYPPGPKDPILENPPWAVISGLGVVLVLAATACFFGVRFLSRKLSAPSFLVSRSLTLTVVMATVVLGICYNSYWTVVFLSLPAWVWVLVERGRSFKPRLLNAVLVAAAGLPWFALTCYYPRFLDVGWRIVWYEILALSTGMFSPAAYFLTGMMVATGLRLAVLQFIRSQD
jgi:hypothetical protein